MDLLLLFDESVILGNTAECKLVHEIDFVRVIHVLVFEVFDNDGESGGEEHDLTVFGVE